MQKLTCVLSESQANIDLTEAALSLGAEKASPRCFASDWPISPLHMVFGRFTGDALGKRGIICIFAQYIMLGFPLYRLICMLYKLLYRNFSSVED